jgi:hypothetical protein
MGLRILFRLVVRLLAVGALAFTTLAIGALIVPSDADTCDSASASDFNGDGNDDIAVGDYRANVADKVAAGAVSVNYGDDELGDGSWTTLTEESRGVAPSGASDPAGAKAAAGDGLGWSIATEQMDADGCLDLIVGAPWRDYDAERPDAGAVYVVFGSPDGLGKGRGSVVLAAGNEKSAQAGQLFGWSVAAAAKRGNDTYGVAVGSPYEDRPAKKGSGTIRDAGAVHIVWLDGDGGKPGTSRTFGQDAEQFPGAPEKGDLFGWAVALGSTGGDPGRRDLIVTEPYEDVDGEGDDVGSITVLNDVSGAPDQITNEHWHYRNIGVPTTPGGHIGLSLAYLEAGGTTYVAAGIPGHTVDGKRRAGAVKTFTSTGSGLNPADLYSASGGRTGDLFGYSVALGGPSVTGSGVRLAAGAPYANGERGLVQVAPLGKSGQAEVIEAGRSGVPGGSGEGDHFGRSVAFTGDHEEEGALLIGAPDDRDKVTGSIVIWPIGGDHSRLLDTGDIDFPIADLTDFGNAIS